MNIAGVALAGWLIPANRIGSRKGGKSESSDDFELHAEDEALELLRKMYLSEE